VTVNSRRKGKAAELEVCEAIRDAGWPNARRTHDGRSQQGRGDVTGGPANCHIEIKRRERLNVPEAFDQITRDANPLDMPVLIHRPSRQEWMATIPLDDFLALVAFKEFAA